MVFIELIDLVGALVLVLVLAIRIKSTKRGRD